MPIVLPVGVSPGSPVTYEFLTQLMESQAQATPADAITAHGALVSNATTNTALVTVPASVVANAVAGSAFLLKASVLLVTPASAPATLAFNGYSGGSGGTALATMTAFTPTVSLAAALADLEMLVTFWSATTVQCTVRAMVQNAVTASASTALGYVAGNASATPVTVTAGNPLTLNAVMGSAVSGSSFEAVQGYYTQES
jgi:hypothetical protein